MTNKNYQIAKFYSLMYELQQKLNSDILPLAVHIGANQEDPSLFESLEILASDIEQHLVKFHLEIKGITLSKINQLDSD